MQVLAVITVGDVNHVLLRDQCGKTFLFGYFLKVLVVQNISKIFGFFLKKIGLFLTKTGRGHFLDHVLKKLCYFFQNLINLAVSKQNLIRFLRFVIFALS